MVYYRLDCIVLDMDIWVDYLLFVNWYKNEFIMILDVVMMGIILILISSLACNLMCDYLICILAP